MTWFPIGPDFVFAPRNPNFKRLSVRNEFGRQGLAKCIAIDSTNPKIIYVVDRPSSGGTAVFRTEDRGASWVCISDSLHQKNSLLVDPIWIAINPSHSKTIYLATGTDSGLYISNDRGQTWGSRKAVPGQVKKFIVDPRTASNLTQTHLIAACDNGVYHSDNAGDTWSQQTTGDVFTLAACIPTTGTAHFYAGIKQEGLFHATDPAGPWMNLNNQNIGLPLYTAGDGVKQEDNFHHILVDVCPKNPQRAYAWFAKPKGPKNSGPFVTAGIYTTASPATKWEEITAPSTTLASAIKKDEKNVQTATPASMTAIGAGVILTIGQGASEERVVARSVTSKTFSAIFKNDHAKDSPIKINRPDPAQGWYNYTFAVAPNSPGDGKKDILFFGRIELFRSVDAGLTWEMEAWNYPAKRGNNFHADQHSFAFHPANPPVGTIPETYIGCDGGIGLSTRYADPGFPFAQEITDYNEGGTYGSSGLYQNLNHACQCSALYQYSSYPTLSALNYIGCQDTGINGGLKSLGWRGLADADGGAMALAPGSDSLILWTNLGAPFYMLMWKDIGDYRPHWQEVHLDNQKGPKVRTTSNYELGAGDICITGAYVFSPETTLTAAVTQNAAAQAVTPASMSGIKVGTVLTINEGKAAEDVTVTAVTNTTFDAVFTKDHPKDTRVLVNRSFIVRVGQDGIAHPISRDFTTEAYPGEKTIYTIVMPDINNADLIVCATGTRRDLFDKVFFTTKASTADGNTLWYEATGNKPANANVYGIAITPKHDIYILLRDPVNTTLPDGSAITTPLFKLVEGDWQPQVCNANPATNPYLYYGKLVAHPTRSDVLFAAHAARVYRLDYNSGTWDWKDIGQGLPGQKIYDLWIGFSSQDKKEQHVVLRAGIPTRGIWELNVATGIDVPAVALYLRDHILDQGLLDVSESGIPNPFSPKQRVRHYQCADIKVDVKQPGTGSSSGFFQTDPEGGKPPFSHVLFDQLQDQSRGLKPGAEAWVHTQVHNRSYGKANNVNVWAIYCNAAAGVPSLGKSASHGDQFKFWDQFTSTGGITPNLPADSPWKAVGKPVVLNGIDVYSPQIASWKWKIPTLSTGDPGHYCLVVFVHGGAATIGESGLNVDQITPANRQVGQKNLHIGAPLGAGGSGGGTGGAQPSMNAYVEFHNAEPEDANVDLRFDFSDLPDAFAATLQFTPLDTPEPVENGLDGVETVRQAGPEEIIRPGGVPAWKSALCSAWNALCALINSLLSILNFGPWDCACQPAVPMPVFSGHVFEVAPPAEVIVPGVRLGGMSMAAAYIRIRNRGALPPGSRYTFSVQQIREERVIGGSDFVVVIEGDPDFPPMAQFPFIMQGDDPPSWDVIELEEEESSYLPPWAVDVVDRRREEMGKME